MKKLLKKHAMKNKFAPDPEFATSPVCIKDAAFDFSVDLSLISMVEADCNTLSVCNSNHFNC